MDFLIIIYEDLLEPIAYLPLGITVGAIFLILWEIWHKAVCRTKIRKSAPKKWWLTLFIIYLTVVLKLAFFSREPGSRNRLDLIPFTTWGDSIKDHAFFIENIVMFLPFGMLFPLCFYWGRKARSCILAGAFFSVCLEILQLVTKRGYCQLDDVLTNIWGTILGFGIWHLLNVRLHR